MKSKKIVVREVSPDLHLITPELHQVSPELISKNGKMQNAVPFPCRLKVSPELGISPAGCFSLRIAKRHILGFRLKKKANGRPRYILERGSYLGLLARIAYFQKPIEQSHCFPFGPTPEPRTEVFPTSHIGLWPSWVMPRLPHQWHKSWDNRRSLAWFSER